MSSASAIELQNRFASLDLPEEKERDPSDLDRRVSLLPVRGPGMNCSVLIGERKVVIIPLDSPILQSSYFKEIHKYFGDEKKPGFAQIPDCFDKDLIEQVLRNQQDFSYINEANTLEAINIGRFLLFNPLIDACNEFLFDALPSTIARDKALSKEIALAAQKDVKNPRSNEVKKYTDSLAAKKFSIVHLDLSDCYETYVSSYTRTIYHLSATEMYGGASGPKYETTYTERKEYWLKNEELEKLLQTLPGIRSLNIDNCDVTADHIGPLLIALPNLRTIKFGNSNKERDFTPYLQQIKQLKFIHIIDDYDGHKNRERLTRSLPHIVIIDEQKTESGWSCTIL